MSVQRPFKQISNRRQNQTIIKNNNPPTLRSKPSLSPVIGTAPIQTQGITLMSDQLKPGNYRLITDPIKTNTGEIISQADTQTISYSSLMKETAKELARSGSPIEKAAAKYYLYMDNPDKIGSAKYYENKLKQLGIDLDTKSNTGNSVGDFAVEVIKGVLETPSETGRILAAGGLGTVLLSKSDKKEVGGIVKGGAISAGKATIDGAVESPGRFVGGMLAGAAGSKGLSAVTKAGNKVGNTVKGSTPKIKTQTPKGYDKVNSKPDKTTTETKLVTQLPQSAFSRSPASTPSGNKRQFITQTRAKSSPTPPPIRTTPTNSHTIRTQQRVSIVGNAPSEFRGNIGQGYVADVKIRGNTFVLTPVDTRITLNTPSPSTLRPVSFDDILQNVIKGSGIAVKTSDRRGTVTNTMQRIPGGVTLEAGGTRARFPDYSPNIYRAVSSEDYFASAIGGRSRGNDIYTYPFRNNSDVRSTPGTIEAINSKSLFRLIDKTLNPAPMKPQNLDAFKGNPRVKEIELVEVGQTSNPRVLPANVQPLKISKITEYVTEYHKISFQGQKSKTGVKYQTTDVVSKAPKTQSRLRITPAVKTTQKSLSKSADSTAVLSIPINRAVNVFAAVATVTVSMNAKVTSIPAVVTPIPSDTDFSSAISGDSSISTSKTGDVDASKVTDKSTSNDSDISRVYDSDTAITTRRQRGNGGGSKKRGGTPVRKDTDSRRIYKYNVNITKTKRSRKRKDTELEEEEKKKKKKVRKTTTRKYIQKTNPLPWETDVNDTSWLRKDMVFMRMPARVKITAVRPKLEAYNEKVKAYNTARKKLRKTAQETSSEGRKALATLKRLYKTAFEARERVVKAIENNRR